MNQPAGPAWSRRFGRSQRRAALPLALLMAVVVWAVVAQVGGTATDGRPGGASARVSPVQGRSGPGASPGAGSPSGSPSPAPPIEVFGAPLDGSVLIRGDGVRPVDLATGSLGAPIGRDLASSHVLLGPGGTAICICGSLRTGPGETTLELRSTTLDATGRPAGSGELVGRWVGQTDPAGGRADQGASVWSTATLSPDGSTVVVGLTVRRPPIWERLVIVVHVVGARATTVASMPDVASSEGSIAIHAWAPSVRFAPDGRHVLVTGGVVRGNDLIEQLSWVAPVAEDGLGELAPIPALSTGACLDSAPDFGSAGVVYAICASHPDPDRILRRVGVDGRAFPDVDLTDSIGDAWPHQLVDAASGRLYLWDPFEWRATAIEVESGKVVASISVPAERQADVDPWATLARAVADWVAPPVVAKMLIDPGLVLSADGSRLYVVAFGGEPFGGGDDRTDIFVLDTADQFDLLARWEVEGLVTSIGTDPDGTLLLATMPGHDDAGHAMSEASLIVLGGRTGDVRARLGRLGDYPITLIPHR